jgi:hypothetical protein
VAARKKLRTTRAAAKKRVKYQKYKKTRVASKKRTKYQAYKTSRTQRLGKKS